MTVWRTRIFFLFVSWCILGGGVFAAHGYNPHLSWREMITPHFRFIFPENLRTTAWEAAMIAEEMRPVLEKFLRHRLSYRPAIILSDHSDIPQGYADPLQGEIHIVVAQPFGVMATGTRLRSWLRMVLAHELTHLLHLDTVGENFEILRSLFGYVVLPNIVQPLWVWEGYAMYGEEVTGGREGSLLPYDMVLQTQALQGTLPPHHVLRGYSFLSRWPGRLGVYIYGASVIDYLAQTFGEEKLAELSLRRSRDPGIFGFERALKATTGISLEELWQRWQEEVRRKAEEHQYQISQSPLSPVTLVTHEGYNTEGIGVSPDGETLVYVLSHPGFRSGLRAVNLKTGRKRLLIRGSILGKPAFSPDGGQLVYAKLSQSRYTAWGDLYLYDLHRKREKRLTFGERAFSPVFWRDRILFLRRNRFPEEACILDPRHGTVESLFKFDASFRPVSLAVSTGGEIVAVAGWYGGKLCIVLLDFERKTWRPVVLGPDITPLFSFAGQHLLFSASLEDTFNIFALDLQSGVVFLLTNVATGMFEPILNDKGLYGLLCTEEGYKVGFIPHEALLWERVSLPPSSQEPTGVHPLTPPFPYTETPYRPLRWLFPRFWVPLLGGFSISAQDPLGFHRYSVSLESSLEGGWSGGFSYQGKFMEPEISFSVRREDEKWTYSVSLSLPLIAGETWGSTLRVGYERFFREDSLYPGYWEGCFGHLEVNFQSGDDRVLTDWGGSLTYRCGFLEDKRTESLVATLWGTWRRAGESHLRFQAEAAFGKHNLPSFFSLGGWKEPWQVTGYPKDVLRGRVVGRMRLGVSLPLVTFDAPFLSTGIVKDLTGTLFVEGGFAGEEFQEAPFLLSLGGELTLQSFVAEGIPLFVTLGYAQSLTEERPGEWYVELGVRLQ